MAKYQGYDWQNCSCCKYYKIDSFSTYCSKCNCTTNGGSACSNWTPKKLKGGTKMSKGNRHRDNFSHGFIETEMYGEQEIKRIYVVNDDGKCIFKTKFSIPHRTDTIKVIVNLALEMLGDYDSTKVYPKKPVW